MKKRYTFKKINPKIVLYIIAIFIFLNLLILINNSSFLISEKTISKATVDGEIYDLTKNSQYYHCRYWTGRSVINVQYYVTAVKQCPFTYKLN